MRSKNLKEMIVSEWFPAPHAVIDFKTDAQLELARP